ncbi:hypothetical protein GH714_011046 [Hevea brasiliensis]|uniref:Peptidase A1 domain-containing protein n=1 Tax=Hevea brasiliensis TaxID=3981 RepID=A0A6A6MYE7_HEVBR|nr:hypothetical protein GH714_011046 [Hevea brasiliensis]
MASLHHFLVKVLLFFFILQANRCSSSKQESLILPLKTQKHPHFPIARRFATASSATNKLLFHHNVSLTVSLTVGSPPQNVTMVLDTGSELSWLHCKKAQGLNSIFSPFASKTYVKVPCSAPTCRTRTRDLTIPVSCDAAKLCHVIISYADASSTEGNLAFETFRIGSSSRPATIFGCMDTGFSSNAEEDAKTTGLMGMNRGSLSFINQMGYRKFSYCISGLDSFGVLLLGDASLPWLKPLSYTPLVQISTPLPYLIGIVSAEIASIAGCKLDISGCGDERIGREAVVSSTRRDKREGFSVVLYIWELRLVGVEAFVIGNHHQQDVWMEFDLEKSRIGLAEIRCDVAGQKLGLYK